MELSTIPDDQAELKQTPSKSARKRTQKSNTSTSDVFEPPVEKTPRSTKRYNYMVSSNYFCLFSGGATPAKAPKVKLEPKDLSPEEQVSADFTDEP
jgi:hypothetical protein